MGLDAVAVVLASVDHEGLDVGGGNAVAAALGAGVCWFAHGFYPSFCAARAPADSVQEDAALWHWLAEYLVGTRTDLDDEIVASETVNDLRNVVKAAIKQGATK